MVDLNCNLLQIYVHVTLLHCSSSITWISVEFNRRKSNENLGMSKNVDCKVTINLQDMQESVRHTGILFFVYINTPAVDGVLQDWDF